MAERNHKYQGAAWQDREQPGLDHELDAALAKYASIEPRPGLEERVLANLRAECRPVLARWFWGWTMASAAAVALIVVGIVTWNVTWNPAWKSGRSGPQNTAQQSSQQLSQQPSTTAQDSRPSPQPLTAEESGVRPRPPIPVQRSAGRHAPPRIMVMDQPRRAQFPTPQPLSEQEQMLASYVAKYPENAAVVAQARAEALERDKIERDKEEANAGGNQ